MPLKVKRMETQKRDRNDDKGDDLHLIILCDNSQKVFEALMPRRPLEPMGKQSKPEVKLKNKILGSKA